MKIIDLQHILVVFTLLFCAEGIAQFGGGDLPIDEKPKWYRDADGDGWGVTNNMIESYHQPSGYVFKNGDCNDNNASIYPKDYYRDKDGDGFGTGSRVILCNPSGYVTRGGDCNDNDAAINPNTTWYLDEDLDNFGGTTIHRGCIPPGGGSLDGIYLRVGGDCNDSNALIHPNTIWYRDSDGDGWGNPAVTKKQCRQPSGYVRNDDDYNDNSIIITNIAPRNFYRDADGDGYGNPGNKTYRSVKPSGYVTNASDCNDSNAGLNPNTMWYRDADADGWGNKSITKKQCAQPHGYVRNDDDYNDNSIIITNIAPRNFYRDADGDTYGNPSVKTYRSVQPSGYVTNSYDCNDDNAAIHLNTTWYLDADGDGWGTNNPFDVKTQCAQPSNYVLNNEDHDDTNALVTNIPPNYYYRDSDGDGWGDSGSRTYRSHRPNGYIITGNDCDDTDASLNPNTRWYEDADGDGWGNNSVSKMQCTRPDGFIVYVRNNNDYDDSTNLITHIPPKNFYKDEDNDTFGNPNIKVYRSVAPTGYVDKGNDCDDTKQEINPNTVWYKNSDGDGFASTTKTQCTNPGSGYSLTVKPLGDCNDDNPEIHPDTVWFKDKDEDGFASTTKTQCTNPGSGYSLTVKPLGDCNDNNPAIYPNTVWYDDSDGDGFGDPNITQQSCTQPIGYVLDNTDQCLGEFGQYSGCIIPPYIEASLSNENYVFTRVFQKEMTTATGIALREDVIESVTYYDGLGRPKQQRAIAASPDLGDIVTHITYDAYGRQDKQYLPFVSSNNGSYQTVNVTNNINSYYLNKYVTDFPGITNPSEVNAYSQSIFEASPLNRVLERGAPGKDWKVDTLSNTDHTIKFDWTTNTALDSIANFDVNFEAGDTKKPVLFQNGFYTANQLYVSITKDENWDPNQTHSDDHTTKEYKDKLGRVVLKRAYNDGIEHDTYYVHDSFGNLTYVIPPKVKIADGVSATELAELCYQYKYDYRNRLIEKKIPGKGDANTFESIVYNKLDQPIMTQDPNQKVKGEWLFTKYDAFGRVAYTGKITILNKTRDEIQAEATGYTGELWVQRSNAVMIGDVTIYYNDGGYPKALNAEVLTINYYDDYDFLASEGTFFNNPITVYGEPITDRTKSLATGTKVKTLDTSYWTTTVSYYDKKARSIYAASRNEYLNTTDIIETKLDFVGKVEKTKTTHKKGSNAAIVTEDVFEYDHMGRLTSQTQKIGNQDTEQIVANEYDELGQLVSKNVGGLAPSTEATRSAGLQTIDYTYNIRGWLKGINDINTIGNDLFTFKIDYNTGANPLYNGNISKTSWQTANDNITRSYDYTYDALNRILTATSNNNRYNVSGIQYDKMGNIESLTRNGWQNTSSYTSMDVLAYNYDDGNKLRKVTDTGNDHYGFKDGVNTNDDFAYDENGNMIVDQNKGISSITYNHLNLPEAVSISNSEGTGTISYIYDATGAKQKKIVIEGSSITTEYAGKYVYENSSLKQISHPEGYLESNGSGGYQYVYQLKDIWGNTRITYADDNNNGSVSTSEIRREQNYYPFGLQHKGYNIGSYGVKNNLKTYQGQEFTEDFGLNTHEWRYRVSDPATGRFWQIDPLAEDYMYNSTYAFQENKMGMGVELEGLELAKFDTPLYDPVLRNSTPAQVKHVRKNQISAAVNGTLLVAATISPVPGDEVFVAGLLMKTAAATIDVASQVAAGGDVDLVGPLMNFAPLGPLTKQAADALVDVETDGTVRTPFFSTNGEEVKSTSEVVIDFAIDRVSNNAQAKIPKEVTSSAVGEVVAEGVTNAAENIVGEVVKREEIITTNNGSN